MATPLSLEWLKQLTTSALIQTSSLQTTGTSRKQSNRALQTRLSPNKLCQHSQSLLLLAYCTRPQRTLRLIPSPTSSTSTAPFQQHSMQRYGTPRMPWDRWGSPSLRRLMEQQCSNRTSPLTFVIPPSCSWIRQLTQLPRSSSTRETWAIALLSTRQSSNWHLHLTQTSVRQLWL